MKIIEFALDHSRTFIAILIFLIIAGTSTYINIPKEAAPDVNIPFIYISLSDRGISPEDSEKLLVKPIEDEVKTVEGLKEMRSTAYSGGGNVLLEFNPGFDADKAIDDIREKVDRAKGELPDNADDPTINEVYVSAIPILLINLFLSLIFFNLAFSSGLASFGIDNLVPVAVAFFGKSLIWPTLDSTINSEPKYFVIVLALAGDSTITRDLVIQKNFSFFYEYH